MSDRPPLYFGDKVLERGSAREWVGAPDGHVELQEARDRALTQLQEAEDAVALRQADLMEATEKLRSVTAERDRCYVARQEARAAVKKAQERVMYVCSTESPPEPIR